MPGFCALLVVPSPKFHDHDVAPTLLFTIVVVPLLPQKVPGEAVNDEVGAI